jgi:uncharacterized protein
MPVRSLHSSVLRWPDRDAVDRAARIWAQMLMADSNVLAAGYFGSYARGDWGVGSDLDLVVIVDDSEQPFIRRPSSWDTCVLPVPAQILVYTAAEWQQLMAAQSRFARTLLRETVWLIASPDVLASSLPASPHTGSAVGD